jgi:hypothetical protein
MPHDYWVYLNEEDRVEFHQQFSQYISTVVNQTIYLEDFTDLTIEPDPISLEIFQIFQEEIQNEINNEILNKLRKNS